ncbi:cytoplasmic tRNA 2-thiolation protein 1 [Nephila pilipes]|uniref:Cytoplasmic tRNA 2-thiolation protein 1 n=1 Tax=Nephila pilipes TaxID=299642 RepID=A0A8X6Q765_NEPPI|nr:cytoplasmic tRNA 2-thiolation protein 1 [Nephila pilipes]
MPINCSKCLKNTALIKRPKTGHAVCKTCFYDVFETEIHETITRGNLFKRGEYVAIAASGGKDSTVLAYVMKTLNDRYDYGLKLVLLSIDEGITGYRDDSLESVKRNEKDYGIPLKILSYEDLYGWTMDKIVKEVGLKNNCTFCGVFRRQALDRGAALLGVDKLVTGHNADDIAETVIMNEIKLPAQGLCQKCGYISSQAICKACVMLEGLNTGVPELGIKKSSKVKENVFIVFFVYFTNLNFS